MRPIGIATLVFASCLASTLMVSAFTGQDRDVIVSHLDENYSAVCWATPAGAIDRLQLAQLQAQDNPTGYRSENAAFAGESRPATPAPSDEQPQGGPTLAEDQFQDGATPACEPLQNRPTPARHPAQRQHQETFQL